MGPYSLLSVHEAADRLGVGPVAVRKRIASGRLPAVKRGRDWWLDERIVDRVARQRPGTGRPLSPLMAWAVLLFASGEEAAAGQIVGRDRYRLRARQWLREHPLQDHAARLRDRAESEQFGVHQSELPRILARPDVLATGVSAADLVGLAGRAASVEVYAPAGRRGVLVDEHALTPGEGAVYVRWVPNEAWSLIASDGRAPRAAVLLDLLESDEPRARREATRALAS